MTTQADFAARLQEMPMVAILRGLPSADAIAVVEALWNAGVRIAEVPLNSPDPFETISLLARRFGSRVLIGAGTVLSVDQVERLASTDCRFCVAPNTDVKVIEASLRRGMLPVPGFSTPSEAFAAIAAGARILKAFPATDAEHKLAALKAVLPADVRLIAVGGVTPGAVPGLRAAGVHAFGIGSELYRPGRSAEDVGTRARSWVTTLQRSARAVPELVCNPEATIGESPVIRPDGTVLWVDPIQSRLLQWSDGVCKQTALKTPVWSLGLLPDGLLVGNGETNFYRFGPDLQTLQPGPDIDVGVGCRLNDMTVDRRGGLWAGTMHRGILSGRGALFHAPSPDAPARKVAEGLGVANGMAFAPDERTLYVVDTLARTLLAYPADVASGMLGEPTIVTDFLGLPGKPDGMAIAPDGSLWVAMWGGGTIVQIAGNGAHIASIPIPAPQVGSLAFDASGQAFVTTSRARLDTHGALARYPGSGGLFVVRP